MTDHLVEILPENWSNLRDLYKSNQSKSYIGYCTIENYIRWLENDPNVKHVKFYCLNGDFSDGTFIVTDRFHAYTDTLNESHENLSRLLVLLDYSKGYMFLCERTELRPTIIGAIERANVELAFADPIILYHLPKEEALRFEIQPPTGVRLHALNKDSDLEKANSVWPHRDSGSIHFFRRKAKYNLNVGAYRDDGTLVSWVLRLPTGLLSALQTDENYVGQGYAALVTKYLSKQIAESGFDVCAGIFEKNYVSRSLFEKLGFKSIGEINQIGTKHDWSQADE